MAWISESGVARCTASSGRTAPARRRPCGCCLAYCIPPPEPLSSRARRQGDPQGTIEMRALIKELKQGGRTVLLSSHLLNEVELTCDRVGVIARGKLVAEGTVDELRARSGGIALLIRATPLDQARRLVESLVTPAQVRVEADALLVSVDPSQAASLN